MGGDCGPGKKKKRGAILSQGEGKNREPMNPVRYCPARQEKKRKADGACPSWSDQKAGKRDDDRWCGREERRIPKGLFEPECHLSQQRRKMPSVSESTSRGKKKKHHRSPETEQKGETPRNALLDRPCKEKKLCTSTTHKREKKKKKLQKKKKNGAQKRGKK